MKTLAARLKQSHTSLFPNSSMIISKAPLSDNVYFMRCFLGADLDDMPNRIVDNDPLTCRFMITDHDGMYEVESNIVIGRLKPAQKFYVMSSEKIRTRKFSGDEDKVVAKITGLLTTMKNEIATLVAEDKFLPLPYDVKSKL